MDRIDIDGLSEEELIDLNHRVVARLRLMREMRAHSEMLEFRIGDRVVFKPDGRPPLTGIVARYNRRSVSVVADSGERWTVSPGLLQKFPGIEHTHDEATIFRLLEDR